MRLHDVKMQKETQEKSQIFNNDRKFCLRQNHMPFNVQLNPKTVFYTDSVELGINIS